MKITIFPSVKETTSGRIITVQDAFNRIRNNVRQGKLIQQIRSMPTKADRDQLKKTLPCYCFSGVFSRKNAASCIEHSGLICLDFDGETKDNIMAKPEFIYACFLSPSGTGYKVLVKIPPSIEEHEEYFDSLQEYFNLPTFDIKVRNISTACFDTEDPDIYINEDAPIFIRKSVAKHKPIESVVPALRLEDPDKIITALQKWMDKSDTFVQSGRNSYIHKFACAMNRFGISVNRAVEYLSRYKQDDFPWSEIDDTVRSAYRRNSYQHNTEAIEDKEPVHYVNNMIRKGVSVDELRDMVSDKYHIPSSKVSEIIEQAQAINPGSVFWTIHKSKDKTSIKIDSEALKDWYARHGIYRYWVDKKSWIMIKEDNFQVQEISEDHIRNIMNDFFKTLPETMDELPKGRIQKTIQDQMDHSYLRREKLAWLPAREIEWQQDTRDTAYFYYRNKAVRITKDGLDMLDYSSELSGCIWSDQIINRDFNIIDEEQVFFQSEFSQFVQKLACGYDTDEDANDQSWFNLCQTIGYILHSYKDPASPKSIILTDEVISDNPEGGIGKGIFIKAISKIKNAVIFDGKNWNWNKSFMFQRVTLSTQVMAFEDVNRSFNFERLFSIVTEGVEVEKKNKDTFYIPYQRSPKVMITSNYAIKGQGGSHDRRRHEIELKQFFSPSYTPRDHFGHNLYDEWDEEQWVLFDNFMMYCVRAYLQAGLSKTKPKNLSYKKLINDVPEEFIGWFDINVQFTQETSLNETCERFKAAYVDFNRTQNRLIMQWIGKLAAYKNMQLIKNHHRNGTTFQLVKMREDA